MPTSKTLQINDPPPDSSDEDDSKKEEEEDDIDASAPRPQGRVPPFGIDLDCPYECKGSVTEMNTAHIYRVGPSKTEAGVIMVGDLWGWNSGRLRAIADYLALVLNAQVAVPRLLDKPPLLGGSDGDGLPPDFDPKERATELRKWLLKYLWEIFKPKVQATATYLRNCGAKRIAGVGFCVGAWIICHASALIGEYACSVLMFPSIHVFQELVGAYNDTLAKKMQCPALFMRARDDPDMYDEGGEVFREVQQRYGKDAESEPFLRMEHGWVTRGDAHIPEVKDDAEKAVLLSAKFLRKFLWPHPRGADAGTLRTCSMEGNEKEMKKLLDDGVPACGKDAVDELSQSPLHYAARAGHALPARLLVDYEADPNARGGSALETPLHVAVGLNHLKVARTLVSLSADVRAIDKAGQTPLHYAAKAGAVLCVRLLLDQKAELGVRDTSEQSALHLAAFMGREQVVTVLLGARMDVEPLDLRVYTPAERATQQGYHVVAQILERERLQREEEEFHAKNPVPAL